MATPVHSSIYTNPQANVSVVCWVCGQGDCKLLTANTVMLLYSPTIWLHTLIVEILIISSMLHPRDAILWCSSWKSCRLVFPNLPLHLEVLLILHNRFQFCHAFFYRLTSGLYAGSWPRNNPNQDDIFLAYTLRIGASSELQGRWHQVSMWHRSNQSML